MDDLRRLFAALGFQDVKTYIQSGNVIFSSDDGARAAMVSKIAAAFETQFGFPGAVIVRSAAELGHILETVPFSAAEIERATQENPDVEHLYVYLSDAVLNPKEITQLCVGYPGKDKMHIADAEIYLLCQQSIRDSKLAGVLAKIPQTLTARNLKTVRKLVTML